LSASANVVALLHRLYRRGDVSHETLVSILPLQGRSAPPGAALSGASRISLARFTDYALVSAARPSTSPLPYGHGPRFRVLSVPRVYASTAGSVDLLNVGQG